jgi:pyruvate dehydrogenase E2 component (dihydrolipoamide acetyltransferase)
MPALSPTMTEGNLAKWVKKEGDKISAGEVIAEIETDKATMEVEAVDEGIMVRILVPQGTEGVPVHSLIAVLVEEDEKDADIDEFIKKHTIIKADKASGITQKTHTTNAHEDVIVTTVAASKEQKLSPLETGSGALGRIFASPLARRIAATEGISLSGITGSGPRGRIIKADILSAGKSSKGRLQRNPEEYRLVPNNNMRKIIAKRLLESKLTIPHFYLSIECMMDAVLSMRQQINDSFGDDKSKKLSVNDFVILASARALKEVPSANASWTDNEIMMYNNVDISVAVAIDGGLITPIIKNADQKDITTISSEMKDLAKRAKENALSPEEFQGGGFSISNLGMYGIKNFSAIINPPQGCIMAVGMSSKRPVVIDDKIEIKTIMDVTISCDHRVVDGAVGATFLAAFKKYIEAPILMFV